MQLDAHPHAAAVLGAALAGEPSHAYLFTGPAGSGKRTAARQFAAALLATDDNARARVMSGVHPDLTWVTPSGAHEMLRSDVARAVVGAAAHTPFESTRRVFVLERADTMNDEAANTLLKTLEEPPAYAVLILLTDKPHQVLPTIASRCQPVRFDPLSEESLTARLVEGGADLAHARACARLSLGDAERAVALLEEPGLREAAERFARTPVDGAPWRALLEAAYARAATAREALEAERDREFEFVPKKEQRRLATQYEERIKRAERRARTGALEHALQLAGLYYRDLACVAAGAPELVHNVDRQLDAGDRSPAVLRQAVELVEETRARLALNVTEELALEALAYRLGRL